MGFQAYANAYLRPTRLGDPGKHGLPGGGLKAVRQLRIDMINGKEPDLELARVHGWLSGDGRAEARLERGKRSPHLELRFFPDDVTVAELFRKSFAKRFGKMPRLYDTGQTEGCYTVRIRDIEICRFALSLGPFGHFVWHLPEFQWQEERIEWIRCFFDDEAHVNRSSKCIQTKSVNGTGLRQVHKAIKELGVEARLYGPYPQSNPAWSPYSMLVIPRSALGGYDALIGFNHPAKGNALRMLLSAKDERS